MTGSYGNNVNKKKEKKKKGGHFQGMLLMPIAVHILIEYFPFHRNFAVLSPGLMRGTWVMSAKVCSHPVNKPKKDLNTGSFDCY